MIDLGLVLEGGGMRGLYTAGVLDFFMEQNLYFSYVIGVSAGACHGSSYCSKQKGRSKRANIDYVKDPRYLSFKNFFKGQGLFGMDFIFDKIPNQLEPFDFDAFFDYEGQYIVGTTDCQTGEALYYSAADCEHNEEILTVVRASSSLPFISPIVEFRGAELLDGGLVDPIPIKKSIADGNQKNIVILTRSPGYSKDPFSHDWLAKLVYRNQPGVIKALQQRHQVYNQTLDYVKKLEHDGDVFLIQPDASLDVDRIERDPDKLEQLYQQGYQRMKEDYPQLKEWLAQNN
ncbi:MAG: patatin-like phospholipase family protein [Bacillota bacterium]